MLDFYSVWPVPVCLLLLYLVAATPIFRPADSPPSVGKARFKTLDGLRGLLASCVVIEHVEVYHRYLHDGVWVEPPALIYDKLGRGVGLFFIMTGYLFWMQLLRKDGRLGWQRFYVARVSRIGPVYLLAAIFVILAVAVKTNFHVMEPLPLFLRHLGKWLALGVFQEKSFNTVTNAWILLAGVTWTLQYEWGFYLSLPLIARGARLREKHLWIVCVALVLSYLVVHFVPPQIRYPFWQVELFAIGMTIASVEKSGKLVQLPSSASSILAMLMLLCAFLVKSYSVANLLLGVAFYLVLTGADFFGALSTRAAVRLGDISYGIYLLQGLVLALIFAGPGRNLALRSPIGQWSLCLLCMVLTALFALIVHRFVELPGIYFGRKLTTKFQL